jgi:hypothetical protein
MVRLDVVKRPAWIEPPVFQIVNVLKVGCQYLDVISLPWHPGNVGREPTGSLASLSCVDARK